MVVEKSDERVTGELHIDNEEIIDGKITYEYWVKGNSDFSISARFQGMCSYKSEERTGSFVVKVNEEVLSRLDYTITNNLTDMIHYAKLIMTDMQHNFENGKYQYTEIPTTSPRFKEFGNDWFSLIQPSYEKVNNARAEARNTPTSESFKELDELEKQLKLDEKRANSLVGIVNDFEIPEPVKTELGNAKYPLISMLVGNYL